MMNVATLLISVITRLACIGFVVVAGFTIPEAWNLLKETEQVATLEDNIVYIPIEICFGTETITDNCHSLRFFINACVASMFFAGFAILLFFLFDCMSRFCKGPITRPSVIGMCLFLTFILVQTAACNYALYKECMYWEEYFMKYYTEIESVDVKDVRTYGNKFFFLLTGIAALSSAGLLFLESVVAFCSGDTTRRNDDIPKQQEQMMETPLTAAASSSHANANYPTDDPTIAHALDQPANPQSWTSY
jgi:hypothetical protein